MGRRCGEALEDGDLALFFLFTGESDASADDDEEEEGEEDDDDDEDERS